MVIERLDLTFAALADSTRRGILARLALGEATVTELAEPFAMTQPAISKHLKVLERAGLISSDRDCDVGKMMGIPIQSTKDAAAGDRAREWQVFGDYISELTILGSLRCREGLR